MDIISYEGWQGSSISVHSWCEQGQSLSHALFAPFSQQVEDHNGYLHMMIHQCDKSGLVFLKIDISSGTTVQKLISTWETYMRNIQQLIFSFLSQTGYRFIGQSVTDVKKMKRCTVYFSLPKQFYSTAIFTFSPPLRWRAAINSFWSSGWKS